MSNHVAGSPDGCSDKGPGNVPDRPTDQSVTSPPTGSGKLEAKDITAIIAVGLVVYTALHYAFGSLYFASYLQELGLGGGPFPVDYREALLFGSIASFWTWFAMISLLIVICLLLIAAPRLIEEYRLPAKTWLIKKFPLFERVNRQSYHANNSGKREIGKRERRAFVTMVVASIALVVLIFLVLWVKIAVIAGRNDAALEKTEIVNKPYQGYYPWFCLETETGTKFSPGAMVVCSERFCGFHDGKRGNMVSLRAIMREVGSAAECQ